jgi:hypothetical protein
LRTHFATSARSGLASGRRTEPGDRAPGVRGELGTFRDRNVDAVGRPGSRAILGLVSAARKVIERAREGGLSADLADELELELVPRLESFLASIPALPPTDEQDETQWTLGLLEIYRPHLPLLLGALDRVIDAVSTSLDDLDRVLQDEPTKRRPLHHLEEALASLVRIGSAAAALIARHPELDGVTQLADEQRPYLRGILCTLVGFDRVDGEVERLAPWAWMARRETLKCEGLFMVELQQRLGGEPFARPRRTPGDLKGRLQIPDDFDAPLPKDVEDSFYGSNL